MAKYNENIHITNYINSLDGDNMSRHTLTSYRSDLRFYEKWVISQGLNITEITLQHLNSYKTYAKYNKKPNGEPYAEATLARRATSIREFYAYLKKNKIITENPAVDMTIPAIEKNRRPIYMTKDESIKLLLATQGEFHQIRDNAILTLVLTVGLRVSELVNINKKDIKENTLSIKGKGNKNRYIHLNNLCLTAINNHIQNSRYNSGDALFVSQQGNRMSVQTVQLLVRKYVNKAKLNPEITPHKLRHTAATLMMATGKIDITTIQNILGHESIVTTQKYTHVLDEQLQNAGEVMENVLAI